MAKLRMVLDYLPCESCKTFPPRNQDQNYLCTVCHRLDRIVATDRQTPQWKMDDGVLAPTDDLAIDTLKPTVTVHEETKILIKEEQEKQYATKKKTGMRFKEEPEEEVSWEETIPDDMDEKMFVPLQEEFEVLEIKEPGTEPILPFFEPVEPLPEWSPSEENTNEPFKVGDYILYTKIVTLRGDRQQRIYFFSKKKRKDAAAIKKPPGYKVVINKRTGLPLLKKKTFTTPRKQKK